MKIEDNRFEQNRKNPNAPDSDKDIVVYNSERVTLTDNVSDREIG